MILTFLPPLRCTKRAFGWSISIAKLLSGPVYGVGLGAYPSSTRGSWKGKHWRLSSRQQWLMLIPKGFVDGRAPVLWRAHRPSFATIHFLKIGDGLLPWNQDVYSLSISLPRPRVYTPSFAAAVLGARRTLRKTRGLLPKVETSKPLPKVFGEMVHCKDQWDDAHLAPVIAYARASKLLKLPSEFRPYIP